MSDVEWTHVIMLFCCSYSFRSLSVLVILIGEREETEREEGFLCHTHLPWTCIKVSKWSLWLHNMQGNLFLFEGEEEKRGGKMYSSQEQTRTEKLWAWFVLWIDGFRWYRFQIMTHKSNCVLPSVCLSLSFFPLFSVFTKFIPSPSVDLPHNQKQGFSPLLLPQASHSSFIIKSWHKCSLTSWPF